MKMRLNRRDNFKLMVLAIVTIASELVTLVSFGTINPYWASTLLFSDWMDND